MIFDMIRILRANPCFSLLTLSAIYLFTAFAPESSAQVSSQSSILAGLNKVAEPGVNGQSTVVSLPSYGQESFIVITELTLPPHWHAYWTNPATVGIPMEASMTPVEGFSVSGPYWAVPTRGESDLGVFYGYEKPRVAFRVTAKRPGLSGEFTSNLSWQMCRDGECMAPEEGSFSIAIPSKAPKGDFSKSLHGLVGIDIPLWSKGMKASASIEGNTVTLNLAFPPGMIDDTGIPPFQFFSKEGEIMPTIKQKVAATADHAYSIKLQRNLNEDSLYPNRKMEGDKALSPLTKLEGVLALNGQGVIIDIPVSQGTTFPSTLAENPAANKGPSIAELLSIVIGLFLGGIILNLMPCVFPVIGLKILSFVKLGGGDRKKVFSHSFAFVVGVIISFWIITVILIGVKEGLAAEGQQITWAFWMGKPYVIFGLIVIMLVMSFSMYGIFEIGVTATSAGGNLRKKEGYAGSFWSGVLATVVATPCTAPFLSGAMAPALALPSWGMFLAFTAMGMGMAFPYMILGAFPHLVKYLPKPGSWMESFKQGISFILLAAAGWLFWVYSVHFEDPLDLLNVIFGLVAICTACWIYGRWCPLFQSAKSRIIGGIVALILMGTGIWLALPPSSNISSAPAHASDQSHPEQSTWTPWSPQAVEKALEENHPVYVDFTARWCATCLTNKKIAYTPAVMKLFKKHGVVLLRADKTLPSPEIDKAMTKLGRAAVPLNVLYLPNDLTPRITREILTPEYLENFLKNNLDSQ